MCVTAFLRVEGDGVVPEGYRLATVTDVRLNVGAVGKVLPGWEIARLAGGAAVSGLLYGLETTTNHRSSELGHSLCVESEYRNSTHSWANALTPLYWHKVVHQYASANT
jgi:hypothetical protein